MGRRNGAGQSWPKPDKDQRKTALTDFALGFVIKACRANLVETASHGPAPIVSRKGKEKSFSMTPSVDARKPAKKFKIFLRELVEEWAGRHARLCSPIFPIY